MGNPPPVTVGVYWINDFTSGQGCMAGGDLDHSDNIGNGFSFGMTFMGHRQEFRRANSQVSPKQWRIGTDAGTAGADTVEFAILVTHGHTTSIHRDTAHQHFVILKLNSVDGCELMSADIPIDQSPLQPLMRLGDGSLRWVVVDACRSLQLQHVNESGQPDYLKDANPLRTWDRNNGGLNMMFGFTGLCSDSAWTHTRGRLFGYRAGHGEPLADAWLEEARSWIGDDVPVALAWGTTSEDARRRLSKDSLAAPEVRLAPAEAVHGHYLWWD